MKTKKTVTFPVYITAKPMAYEWESDKPCMSAGLEFVARNWLYKEEPLIQVVQVTVDFPADLNPVAMKVAKLEADRTELLADTQIKVNHINDAISKLQALTFEAPEVEA